ncbi:hypothetical protein WN55_10853 [Dufourea novaeangliae]|uniref:Uncharacterized protein n=1 Tax=Dufourea novaeangliae TaxID=178035 RepID=A0A154P9F4_DUFNO|nr:hypothetical protein WN55_10853 [Dufourea novaeangliae]
MHVLQKPDTAEQIGIAKDRAKRSTDGESARAVARSATGQCNRDDKLDNL